MRKTSLKMELFLGHLRVEIIPNNVVKLAILRSVKPQKKSKKTKKDVADLVVCKVFFVFPAIQAANRSWKKPSLSAFQWVVWVPDRQWGCSSVVQHGLTRPRRADVVEGITWHLRCQTWQEMTKKKGISKIEQLQLRISRWWQLKYVLFSPWARFPFWRICLK